MTITAAEIYKSIEAVRDHAPVVHNITNYVVMNSTANALLALGASPVMAHAENEIRDMVNIASALVINIGTLSDAWIRSMFKAAVHARKRGIPIVFDPVGAGATPYRTQMAQELIDAVPPTIIRGNASEIMALVSDEIKTKGVDSSTSSDQALVAAQALRQACGSVVCISGETDYIVGDSVIRVMNGHPMMTSVTGLGCTATALCGAFAAVEKDYFSATVKTMAVMGITGEMAAELALVPAVCKCFFWINFIS